MERSCHSQLSLVCSLFLCRPTKFGAGFLQACNGLYLNGPRRSSPMAVTALWLYLGPNRVLLANAALRDSQFPKAVASMLRFLPSRSCLENIVAVSSTCNLAHLLFEGQNAQWVRFGHCVFLCTAKAQHRDQQEGQKFFGDEP